LRTQLKFSFAHILSIGRIFVCWNSHLFVRNQLEAVYSIFLNKTFKIVIIRGLAKRAHRKFSISFTPILFVWCFCNRMAAKPTRNLTLQIKYDFFFKCMYSCSEMNSLVLQRNVPKMPVVCNESDQEISWDMFKDGFNFFAV